jgi:hypothetical protein
MGVARATDSVKQVADRPERLLCVHPARNDTLTHNYRGCIHTVLFDNDCELMARGNSMLQGAASENVFQLPDSLDFVKPPGTTLTDSAALFRRVRIVAKSVYKLHQVRLPFRPHVSVWVPLAELSLNYILGTSTNI